MYVIRLNTATGDFYKAISDEGFYVTQDTEEATKFTSEKEAKDFLNTYAVVTLYPAATIERIHK